MLGKSRLWRHTDRSRRARPATLFFSHSILQAKQQQHSRSLGRLKEQLRWIGSETDALKRQLSDRDKQLAALRQEGLRASGSGSSSLAGGASYTSGSWRGGGGV